LQMIPYHVQKWLGKQSKDFFAAGLFVVVKLWDMFYWVGGGYVEK
jgi:hypothetical protein